MGRMRLSWRFRSEEVNRQGRELRRWRRGVRVGDRVDNAIGLSSDLS